MTNKTDKFIKEVQMSSLLDDIIDDLRESQIPKPRIHSITNFTELATILIVYDKFCAILEYDANNQLEYVALGRNDAETLNGGMLELVDVRMLDDEFVFGKGVKAFKGFSDNHAPQFMRDIPEIKKREEIIGTILDTWKLGHEIEMSGGFH